MDDAMLIFILNVDDIDILNVDEDEHCYLKDEKQTLEANPGRVCFSSVNCIEDDHDEHCFIHIPCCVSTKTKIIATPGPFRHTCVVCRWQYAIGGRSQATASSRSSPLLDDVNLPCCVFLNTAGNKNFIRISISTSMSTVIEVWKKIYTCWKFIKNGKNMADRCYCANVLWVKNRPPLTSVEWTSWIGPYFDTPPTSAASSLLQRNLFRIRPKAMVALRPVHMHISLLTLNGTWKKSLAE